METISPPQSLKATRSESDGYLRKRSKKYKKWSIGGFFRRKKKVTDTDSSSSSEDIDRKGFHNRRSLRKSQSRENNDYMDHSKANHSVRHNADIVRFEQSECTQSSEHMPVSSYESLLKRQHKLSNYRGRSLEDVGRTNLNSQIKARMERSSKEYLRDESSSDENGELSMQISSVKAGSRDGSVNLRSRASRTQRYKKRVLRHDESFRDTHNQPSCRPSRSFDVSSGIKSNEKALPNNQWSADIVYYESSDYETKYTAKLKSASSSPVQSPKTRHKSVTCHTSSPTPSTVSVPTQASEGAAGSNSDLSYSFYGQPINHIRQKPSQRHVNTVPPRLPKSNNCDSIFTLPPLSRPMHMKNEPYQSKIMSPPHKQIPPQPPPRDPQRKVIISNGSNNKSNLYNSFNEYDNNCKQLNYARNLEFGSSDSAFKRVHLSPQNKQMETFSSNESHLSNSDHLVHNKTNAFTPSLSYQRSTVHPEYSDCKVDTVHKRSEAILGKEPSQYHYFSDQPRSRKPIHFACKSNELPNECYLSDSQVALVKDQSLNQSMTPLTKSEEFLHARNCWILKDPKSVEKTDLSDDSSIINQSNLQNISPMDRLSHIGPYVSENLNNEQSLELNPLKVTNWQDLASSHSEVKDIPKTPHSGLLYCSDMCIPVEDVFLNDGAHRELSSHPLKFEIPPIANQPNLCPTPQNEISVPSTFEYYDKDHKSINIDQNRKNLNSLEDALNELEAIYKSLKLDDDKYLEKYGNDETERNKDTLDEWDNSSEVQSNLSYKYNNSTLEYSDNTVNPNKRPNSRRSETPNPVTDDMAYRRLIKKEKPTSQEKEVISQAGSFLLVSPTLSPPPFFELASTSPDNKEPDITYDDVVYRNIQHTNNTFKILDPQPPFGIPLWPVTPAPNSSYLCVNSKDTYRPTFKPKKYPDIVADDLAFRNLRKDKSNGHESKVKADLDKIKKSNFDSCYLSDTQKITKKDLSVPLNRRLTYYNNNNLEEDLDELQSFLIVKDSNKVRSFVPKPQYAKPIILRSVSNCKDKFSAEDSIATPKIATSFSNKILSSSKSLTERDNSTLGKDFKQANFSTREIADSKIIPANNSFVRIEPISIVDFDKKSVSSEHQTKNLTSGLNTKKSFSPLKTTTDKNHTLVSPNSCEESHELNNSPSVSKEPKPINGFEQHDSDRRSHTKGTSTFQAQGFDQLPTCKMVNLDTLSITNNDNVENEHSALTANTTGVDMEQSLIDLCLELEDSSNFHFVEYNVDGGREHSSTTENSTSSNANRAILESYLTNDTTDVKTVDDEFHKNCESEIHDTSSLHCSGEKQLTAAKPIVLSHSEDSAIKEKSYQPLSQDSDEDRVSFASSPPLSTVVSNEGKTQTTTPKSGTPILRSPASKKGTSVTVETRPKI